MSERCKFCGMNHACPKCGQEVPANLDRGGYCTGCCEWRFHRDRPRSWTKDPGRADLMPEINYCPRWEELPPSEVMALRALSRSQAQESAAAESPSEQMDIVTQAIALLFDAQHHHRHITIEDVASAFGVHRSTIYRSDEWKRFRDAWQARKRANAGTLPRGYRDDAGNLEAE